MTPGDEIRRLCREKDAIILAHNYQLPEVQEVADVVGDSLELSIHAKKAQTSIIVFCGVDFMAETAKILNPSRKVLLPVKDATCPLARMLTPERIQDARKRHPRATVVLYVNSTAECKALADVVCTSANAEKVVRSLPEEEVLFGPDANLAYHVQSRVPEKRVIPLPPEGHCYVHTGFTVRDAEEGRKGGAMVICHPECTPEVQAASDLVASTGGMVREAHRSDRWVVLTEREMTYRLSRLYPGRVFIAKDNAVCHDMKKTTLKDVHRALEKEEHQVVLPEEIMARARRAIERMIEIGR